MTNALIACPPTFAQAQEDAPAPTQGARFRVTPLVRSALASAMDDEGRYAVVMTHYNGGDVTGSIQGDQLFLAKQLVEWELEESRPALNMALEAGVIKLKDIGKHITPLMRKRLPNNPIKSGSILARLESA